jgi:hypothetical protein
LRPLRTIFTALLSLSLASITVEAAAQPADAMERARKAFAEGAEAENRNDCATAIQRFEEVVTVKETPAVRLRIGRCNEKLGKLVAAQRDYERAKELAATEPQALEVASQVAADLAKRIPRIDVRLVSAPEATVVKIDGVELPAGAQTKPVDPGKHRVTAEAEGYEAFDETFDLAEGGSRALTITLRALKEPGKPPPPPLVEEEETPFPWLPVALYGGGAIAIGVGIPLLITSLSDDAALDEKCFDETGAVSADRKPCLKSSGARYSKSEQEEITSDRESIITRQIVGWSLIGVGAAAAGVATVLLVTDDGGDEADAAAITTTPVVGPGYAGWSVAGHF